MANRGVSGDYHVDLERSRIGFTARHALVSKVKGRFDEFVGSAVLDFEDPGSSAAQIIIQVTSIETGNGPRDEQLRVNDFLDAARYPTITFTSTQVEKINDKHFDVTGDLTIKASTREVTVRFDLVAARGQTPRFRGSTSINRRDWKVEWPAPLETGGLLVGDTIGIQLDITLVPVQGS